MLQSILLGGFLLNVLKVQNLITPRDKEWNWMQIFWHPKFTIKL